MAHPRDLVVAIRVLRRVAVRAASGDAVARAARHAEDLGFVDVWVSDHVVHPAEQGYPSPFLLDPFVTLAWAAAS